ERLLMERVGDRERRSLIESVPPGDVRKWVRDTLDANNPYRFHILFSLFWLRASIVKPVSEAARWQRIVASLYGVPAKPSVRLQELQRLYRRIRRFAFLSLDAEYCPTVLGLRPSRLLSDPEAIGRLFSRDEDGGFVDEMSSLETFLSRHVYL